MLPKMHDLGLLEEESIYIPSSSISIEKKNGQERKVYAAYCATLYRRYGVWIQPFADIVLDKNDKPIYFHTSKYIPYLTNQGYKVEVVEGCYLVDYLSTVAEGSFVMISVKDEGSQKITPEIVEQLQQFGITQIDKSKLRHSFIWIAHKQEGAGYEVLYEACSAEELRWEGNIGEVPVIVASGGALATNQSSIQVNGVEWSLKQRGFNIVTCGPNLRLDSISFDTFATLHAEGSLFRASSPRPKVRLHTTIGHAGGRIDGINGSNCKEAFEHSYTHRGHRVFEADLEMTSDGELVLRDGWNAYLYRHLQQQQPEGIHEAEPLALEQFLDLKIKQQYTPMTVVDLFQFLITYPDVQVITHTQSTDSKRIEQQFTKLVELTTSFNCNFMHRIIPQVYNEEMYDSIEKVFPFPRYAFKLYQTKATDEEVIRFVKDKKIRFVTASQERYSKELGKRLKSLGSSVFIHTINDLDVVREYIREEADGFYTDALTSAEIEQEFLAYRVELDTRREMLCDFLVIRFRVSMDEAWNALASVSLRELAIAGERLFQASTLEEVYSVLK
ncbi:interleukin-like EMT inducer domain-containing protein [Cohnella cholangitidis]|nr:interleukin-like EMT inducer domain-containing protein [Cohnella cholangitidis]